MKRFTYRFILLVLLLLAAGCEVESNNAAGDVRLEVVVDGQRTTYSYNRLTSVGQLLDEYEIEVSPLDKVNPPQYTQITDGMIITIVRVTEEVECREEPIEKETERIEHTEYEPGEIQVVDPGEDGLMQVCYRTIYEDGAPAGPPIEQNSTIIRRSQPRVEYIGVVDRTEPVEITGTLAYIASGRAYLMQENSTLRRTLTPEAGLDGRVFDLSPDGQRLLYTRQTADPDDPPFSNYLWVIMDVTAPTPVEIRLDLPDVLWAQWQPGSPDTFAYSTATPADIFAGWSAYNDLSLMQIDNNGTILSVDPIIESNASGAFARWGTRFKWSPDGARMAYAKADGVGLVDFENGTFGPLQVNFPYLDSVSSQWVWQPQISWSSDGQWIVTTVHGPPFGAEQPENSIIFDMGVFNVTNNLIIDSLIEQVGMWATPAYSSITKNVFDQDEFSIAYLQARDPFSSLSSPYDLVLADRDGSNPRVLFPGRNQDGLRPVDAIGEDIFVWEPAGQHIAIVYQNDLWLVDVISGIGQRITNEGPVETPRWVP